MTKKVVFTIFFGIFFVIISIMNLISGTIWGVKASSIPFILMAFVGLYFIYEAITKKFSIFSEYMKCPSCGYVQIKINNIDKCKKCGKQLESLSGFFDRRSGSKDAQHENSADPKNRAAD